MDFEKIITELRSEINNLKDENKWLREQLELAKHRRFGASSEQFRTAQFF